MKKSEKHYESQLIMRRFPQFISEEKKLSVLREEYRRKMISIAGISIIILGNLQDEEDNILNAKGVKREFEIVFERGQNPIALTGYVASEIFNIVIDHIEKYYNRLEQIVPLIKDLADKELNNNMIIQKKLKNYSNNK